MHKPTIRHFFIRYISVGLINTGLTFVIYLFCGIYTAAGVAYLIAAAIITFINVTLHHFYTTKDSKFDNKFHLIFMCQLVANGLSYFAIQISADFGADRIVAFGFGIIAYQSFYASSLYLINYHAVENK